MTMRFNQVMRGFVLTLALLGAVVAPSARVQAADEAITADQRLPDGVLLYLSVPDVKAARGSFQQTGMGQLINDPEFYKFRAQIVEKINEGQEKLKEELGVSASEIGALLAGELTLAVIRPVGEPLGGVFFMDIGENQATLDKLLAKVDAAANDNEKVEKGSETIDGVAVTTYAITVNETADPVTVAYFVKDQKLVVASGVSILEGILEQWDGESEESFAESEVYSAIMEATWGEDDSTPAFLYYADPVGLLATGLGMSPDTQLFASMVYAPAFGLSGFKGVGGTVELATGEYDSIVRSLYYVDGPASGLLKIFEFRPTISAPPEWVPADVGQFGAADWNVKGAYEAIESIYDSFTGPGKFAEIVTNISRQSGSDLHLKRDVIDILSGQVQWYMLPGTEDSELNGTLAIGVTDTAKGQKLVDTALGLSGGADESDFNGTKLSSPATGEGKGVFAVKDNQILISVNADQLKLALSGTSKTPLVKSAEYKKVAESIPEKVSALGYQNIAEQLESGYEKARAGEFDGITEGKIDFGLLPPFDAVRKHLAPSASYFVPTENGTLSVQFSLKRK